MRDLIIVSEVRACVIVAIADSMRGKQTACLEPESRMAVDSPFPCALAYRCE